MAAGLLNFAIWRTTVKNEEVGTLHYGGGGGIYSSGACAMRTHCSRDDGDDSGADKAIVSTPRRRRRRLGGFQGLALWKVVETHGQ